MTDSDADIKAVISAIIHPIACECSFLSRHTQQFKVLYKVTLREKGAAFHYYHSEKADDVN